MKAFTYTDHRALRLLSREKPEVQLDTAVMRIVAAAICGTDLRTYRHGCGICRWCRAGKTNMCDDLHTVGFDYDGTFADYMQIPAQAFAMGNVLLVGDAVPAEEAVLAEPTACCMNGQKFLQIGGDDTVFIFGSGYIGCIHAELALKKGAQRVIISDVSDGRLGVARALLPPLDMVNTTSGDAVRFVRDRTDGRGADVIITACPSGDAHEMAMQMAATRARISLFGGIPGEGQGFLNSNTIHYGELSVFGSHASTVAQNRQVLDWLSAGRLDLGKYISATFSLADIPAAFEALRSEKVLKVLIRPGGP
jgi:L-iditol 2-dehydrogenase